MKLTEKTFCCNVFIVIFIDLDDGESVVLYRDASPPNEELSPSAYISVAS
jgi:hypothetical protein